MKNDGETEKLVDPTAASPCSQGGDSRASDNGTTETMTPRRHNDDPSGILNLGKTRKTFIQGFFEPYNFPKGWGQASNNYIQHIYSYSTLSNYSKAQHGRGNKFANTIGTHQ